MKENPNCAPDWRGVMARARQSVTNCCTAPAENRINVYSDPGLVANARWSLGKPAAEREGNFQRASQTMPAPSLWVAFAEWKLEFHHVFSELPSDRLAPKPAPRSDRLYQPNASDARRSIQTKQLVQYQGWPLSCFGKKPMKLPKLSDLCVLALLVAGGSALWLPIGQHRGPLPCIASQARDGSGTLLSSPTGR